MKVKFGAMVVDGRGKLGGHVFSKNRAGAYVRTKVTPVNPQTATQSAVRAILTFLAQSWAGLAGASRAAWDNAVSSFARTDIFGDIKQPTGLNLYTKLNANILNAGGVAITVPPSSNVAPANVIFTPAAAAGAGTFTLGFAPTPVPANTAYLVDCTPMVGAGISFLKNRYRRTTQLAAATVTGASISAAYVAKFGALTAGKKIGVRIKSINLLTGITSQSISEVITVAV